MSSSTDDSNREQDKNQARPKFSWPELRKAIEFYEKERLRYLPAGWGGKKPSLEEWKQYQGRLPTLAEKADWFHEGKPTNIGVLCGAASGGLVLLCFNDPDGAREFWGEEQWHKLLQATFVTKSGRGNHVWLRSDTPIKSQFFGKGENKTWLEVRSDGNFTVAPPSLHPSGVLYQAVGSDHICKPEGLAGFIDKRLSELGLTTRRTQEAPGGKPKPSAKRKVGDDKFYVADVEKLLENCAFIQYCRDNATTLSEPWWWSMIAILAVFGKPGREKIHELSQPYPGYTERGTERKIEEALKAGEKEIGPHTCLFIEQGIGFNCPRNCLAKTAGVASPSGLGGKLTQRIRQYGEPIREEPEEQAGLPPMPKLPEDCWQGLFRDYRDLVAGTTEAPDNYHYICFAQTLGATLARRTHVYHARRLFPNFYICLVGRTAITRKDTARYRAQRLLNDLHSEENPENPQFQILPGIGSAEGLLDALGGERKVVVLSESELLSLLAKARQEALSNLIPKLTSLFDCPDLETLKTRQRTVVCKEPFLSISSGTTLAWLQKALTEKDIYGGFANRFIFVYGNPKPPLPFPPKMNPDAYTALLAKINDMRLWAERLQQSEAGGELTVPDTTRALFADYYAEYHNRCAAETLPATLIPRVQTFVWKFGLLYAAMAASEQILPEHLEPAILAGNYFEQSVLQIFRTFGASRGKEVEDKLLTYLQSKGKGIPIPQRVVYKVLNLSAAELEHAAKPLERLGLIKNSTRLTEKGRRVLCFEAI